MTTALEPSLMLAAADVELTASGRPPTISVVGYTGGMMRVPPFGDLVIDLAGLQLSGDPIPILADHDSSLRGIIGHGVARVNAGRLLVQGTLIPGSETTQRIIELNKSGFRFQASVGVAPGIVERVRAGETLHINNRTIQSPQTAFSLVRTGELREISLVALGADASTSVSIAASRNKGFGMTTDNNTPTADEIRAEALAETERIAAIRKACGSRFTDIEATAIRDGWDGQRTELEVLRASRPVVQVTPSRPEPATRMVLTAAILAHMGHESLAEKHLGADAAQRARDLRATNLMDLCKAALTMEHRELPHGRDALIQASISTYSLPAALGDSANKILLESYNESPATWRAFANIKSTNDFKNHTGIRPSDTGELTEIAPGGEIKHGGMSEKTYSYSVGSFGKMISVDRRDIVNDDLSVFEQTAQLFGRTAMRSLSDLVYKVLLANAGSFFSGGNVNYDAGAGTVLSIASLNAGIARMLAQRDAEKRDLDIRPRTLLVPPELQQSAKELLLSDFVQRTNNDTPTGNALKNSVALEVEPRLSNSDRFTGTSAKAWYLFGSPSDAALVVAFLNGVQTPTVEFFGFDSTPNRLAASWRVYFDYGAALADFRAAYKAKGEA